MVSINKGKLDMSSVNITPQDEAIASSKERQWLEELEKNGIPYAPDHTQLPESDGTFVKNFQEHPQSILLTDSITPILQQLHPDNQYAIGQDSGIYWRLPEASETLYKGAESPDWFYVPGVPPLLKGKFRRSYVLWKEFIPPLIVLEFVSGDGSEERDKTPHKGKFWIYEQVIRPLFYGIYEEKKARVELYHWQNGSYQLLAVNERGHYPIPQMGVELGIWNGDYQNYQDIPWLRWWDLQGNLLLTSQEREQQERQRAEQAESFLQTERQRAEKLAERLRQMGIDPESIG